MPKQKKLEEAIPEEQVELEEELSEEETMQLMEDIDNFQDSFLKLIAGSDKFEIIPTIDDNGDILGSEQLALLKRECNKLGASIVYAIDTGKQTIVVCPGNLEKFKIGVVSNGAEVH